MFARSKVASVVLIAFVAINTVECILKDDVGTPMECKASPAAVAPSVARKMCKELIGVSKKSPDIETAEDLASGCACGLSTHSIWYKGLTTHLMLQISRITEQVLDLLFENKKLFKCTRGFNLSPLHDKLRLLIKENDNLKSRFDDEFWPILRSEYYDIENGEYMRADPVDASIIYKKLKAMAKNSCYNLLQSPLFRDLIEPGLAAIRSTMGKRADYEVISSQPDLMRVMNFAHLCRAVIGEQQDPNSDY